MIFLVTEELNYLDFLRKSLKIDYFTLNHHIALIKTMLYNLSKKSTQV